MGIPKQIKTDNGSRYTKAKFQKFCQQLNISHITNTTYNPQKQKILFFVRWRDPLTNTWHGPDPVLIWGRGLVYVFPQDAEGPRWLRLTGQAQEVMAQSGQPVTPAMLLAILALVTCAPAQDTLYWAYVPDPPFMHPAAWSTREGSTCLY